MKPRKAKSFEKISPIVSKALTSYNIKDGVILDIGAGTKIAMDSLIKYGWKIEAVEIDPKKAQTLCNRYKENNNIVIVEKHIKDYILDENKYSIINARHVFHFIDKNKYAKLFYNLIESLKLGGIFIITMVLPESPQKPSNFLNSISMDDLIDNYLKPLKILKKDIINTTDKNQYVFLVVGQKV